MADGEVTAVLTSPDTAPVAEETPPVTTETAFAAPETETASDGETTETEDPLAAFDEEALKASPRLKALLDENAKSVEARKEESFRQKSEAAQKAAEEKAERESYARNLAQLDEMDRVGATRALFETFDSVVDPQVDPDAKERLRAALPKLSEMAQTLQQTTHTRLDRQYVDATNELLQADFPDYRIPPEDATQFDQALSRGDFQGRFRILAKIIQDATKERESTTLRDSLSRELRAEMEKETALQKQREAEAAGGTKPTNVAGRTGTTTSYSTKAEASRLFMNGQIDINEMRRARNNSSLPEF